MTSPPAIPNAVVVGAGLAGLTCAGRLAASGKRVVVLEAGDGVGGRVRTDRVDGFLLDRGFQVFNTAYAEAEAVLDFAALRLRPFEPGALTRVGGRFHRLSDPWRRPTKALATALSGAATLGDKARIARLRERVRRGPSLDENGAETTTLDALRRFGFSDRILARFFRPFLGGVFLEPDLATSSRMFEFVFRSFADGRVTLPSVGMGAIAAQLAERLPDGAVELNTPVEAVRGGDAPGVVVRGESRAARAVVIAADGPAAGRLVDGLGPQRPWRRTTCVYFAADRPPIEEPILLLNGEGPQAGPINSLCVPSRVAPDYAPDGQSLVSATVLGDAPDDDDRLFAAVTDHAAVWFGESVRGWRPLKVCRVSAALPDQSPPAYAELEKPARLGEGLYVCGDHRDTASINGAIGSGRRAAEAVLSDLASGPPTAP